MRLLYSVLLYVLGPLLLLRLVMRGLRQPEYRQRLGERLGMVVRPQHAIEAWVHAVSVGETLAALPLIEALIARYGEGRVWVTTTTPTGSARVQAALGDRVVHSYAPYDWPGSVARFLRRVRPRAAVVMETELWPNLFASLYKRGIPLLIANARLSPRSFRGYRRIAGLARGTLRCTATIAAQSQADAERFRQLGAPHVQVMGNLKFDLTIPEVQLRGGKALRVSIGQLRPVWAAVSTHEGEEAAALDAHRAVLDVHPNALLLLVPRHPQRFEAVWSLVDGQGFTAERRSRAQNLASVGHARQISAAQVFLGDSMGEMFVYLAASDLAFVGGSLTHIGGHNVLEPAAIGLPVLFGPHMFNFAGARELLLGCDAAVEVSSASALAGEVAQLLGDAHRREGMGRHGRVAVAGNRGALQRLVSMLDGLSPAPA